MLELDTGVRGSTSEHPGHAPWPTSRLFLAWLCVLMAVSLPTRSAHLYEWDAVQYALGMHHFDLAQNQPHPPGYPLAILVPRLLLPFMDENLALIVMDIVMVAAACTALHLLARELYGSEGALIAPLTLASSPLVLLYCRVAGTYPADLLTSALTALLVARSWRGDRMSAVLSAVCLGILGGFRLQGMLQLLPLFALAIVAEGRIGWRRVSMAVGSLCLAVAVWAVPLAMVCLKSGNFLKDLYGLWGPAVAPMHDLGVRIAKAVEWLLLGIAPAVLLNGLARLMLLARPPTTQRVPHATWHRPLFYLAWMGPTLFVCFAMHTGRPGHLLLCLPPFCLLLAPPAAKLLKWPPDLSWKVLSRLLLLVGTAPAIGVALALFPFERLQQRVPTWAWYNLTRASLRTVRQSDALLARLPSLLPDSEKTCVLVFPIDNESLNWRKVSWYLPDYRVVHLPGMMMLEDRHTVTIDAVQISEKVKYLCWITDEPRLPGNIMEVFPDTRAILSDPPRRCWIWQTSLERIKLPLRFHIAERTVSVERVP